jgi:hypothetical protein
MDSIIEDESDLDSVLESLDEASRAVIENALKKKA